MRQGWAARHAALADFADARLNTRFGQILSSLAAKPSDSIPQAFGAWGATKATYRFLANDRISLAELRQPMIQATVECCRGKPAILAVQDTTSLNFSSLRQTTGLGPINDSSHAQGLELHSTLALNLDGIPIGMLAQDGWARPKDKQTKKDRKKRPFEEKESYKWARGIQHLNRSLEALPEDQRPHVIHIFDREGDIHEVFQLVLDCNHSAIIRASWNRRIEGPYNYAFNAVRASQALGTTTFTVPRQKDRPVRKATVELRVCSVRLNPSAKHNSKRKPLSLKLVEVFEPHPPEGQQPLHWLLWTLETVENFEQALAVVQAYRFRWSIEDVHLVLKSGCNIEKLQFDTAERLLKAVALYTAVAIRIVRLRDQARRTPDADCTEEFHHDEWRVLYAHLHPKKAKRPSQVPTLREATLWLGRLGGHMGRKRDRMPGVRVLWRGMRDLQILVAGYRAALAT